MSKSWARTKDPDEVVDYDVSWLDQMTADGDTIISSEWTVPPEITKDSEDFTTTRTKVWLSGGNAGETYSLLNRIETAGGRTFDQSVRLKMKDH